MSDLSEIDLYQYILSGAILSSAVFGMLMMFKKKVPMYFTLHVCGVWCYAIGLIYLLLMVICGETYIETRSLDPLAAAGMFTFFTSANYGTFNSLIDDSGKKKYCDPFDCTFCGTAHGCGNCFGIDIYGRSYSRQYRLVFDRKVPDTILCVFLCQVFADEK